MERKSSRSTGVSAADAMVADSKVMVATEAEATAVLFQSGRNEGFMVKRKGIDPPKAMDIECT
jgi:hypothetical protein